MSSFAFLSQFTCLGEKCPEHCCGSWAIEVDQETKIRWYDLGSVTTENFLSNIESVPDDPHGRSIFKKNADNNCCNLNTQGLCQIQAVHGHEYLPKICQEYPRRTMLYPGDILQSGYLSCPEICRLALASDTPLLSVQLLQALPTTNPLSSLDQVSGLLYVFVNRVLQEDKYYPSVQLHSIASALAVIYATVDSLTGPEVDTLTRLKSELKKPKEYLARSTLARKSCSGRAPAQYFSSLMQTIVGFLNQHPMRFPPCDYKNTRLYKALMSPDQNDIAYMQSVFAKLSTLLAQRDYALLRRYIIVSFYNRGFPLLPSADNFILSFLLATLPHFLVNFLLACMLERDGQLPQQQVLNVIYKVERKTSHSQALKDFLVTHRTPFDCLEHLDIFFYLY